MTKNASNELWLSPLSTYEALTLHHKKRVYLAGDLDAWLSLGTREAVLTQEIATEARRFQLHQDPIDRILAANALVLDLTLVTEDEQLLKVTNVRTLANRT